MPAYLYIHIPFCIRKCLYCDFFSVPYEEPSVRRYVDALCRELTLKKNTAGPLRSIFIGGGTPSLLPADCVGRLFQCLRENFILSPGAEITFEANPGTLDGSKVDALISSGVNRMSIGIQSFHDGELRFLGRIHNAVDAIRSIDLIRRAGIKNYSIDLMYGMSVQTLETWTDSLQQAVRLSPAHISTYELTPEEGTPLFPVLKSSPAPEELILEMYNRAINVLGDSGYRHYEISNFALPGFSCRHNLNYWDRGEYIGAGAGAHSFVDGIRAQNIPDVAKYIGMLDAGIMPEAESLRITAEEALKEKIFLGLRKREGLLIDCLSSEEFGGRVSYRDILEASAELMEEGHLDLQEGYLKLTPKGVVISNTVIVRLFDRLGL